MPQCRRTVEPCHRACPYAWPGILTSWPQRSTTQSCLSKGGAKPCTFMATGERSSAPSTARSGHLAYSQSSPVIAHAQAPGCPSSHAGLSSWPPCAGLLCSTCASLAGFASREAKHQQEHKSSAGTGSEGRGGASTGKRKTEAMGVQVAGSKAARAQAAGVQVSGVWVAQVQAAGARASGVFWGRENTGGGRNGAMSGWPQPRTPHICIHGQEQHQHDTSLVLRQCPQLTHA